MKKLVLIKLCALFLCQLQAQDSLSLSSFLKSVREHHPLFEAAQLNVEIAAAKLRAARGNFDPKLQVYSSEKTFNGSDYYDHNLVQLKIPVYSGIEIKSGYELNTGKYLNPEATTPAEGLMFTEISVPVLKNLLLNQGRAEMLIQQAHYTQSQFEWQLAQNDLAYLISSAYWEYRAAFEQLQLYQEAVEVAASRLSFVKRSYVLGKYAAIDTVEAYMEWQRRMGILNENKATYTYSSYALSNQFWRSDSLSRVGFIPSGQHILPIDSVLAMANRIKVYQHPAIRQIDQKIAATHVDKNLQKQNILPELTLRYKPLTSGGESLQYSSENITWGATFQMPLLFRKEMGKYRAAEGKMDQLEFERMFKIQSLSNDLRSYKEAILYWKEAVVAQQENVEAAQLMLNAEKRKLELGNATIFMVNYRERYFLDSRVKLIKAQKEYSKAQSAFLNKLGVDIVGL